MADEIERRFVIEAIDPEFFRQAFRKIEIEQGYYQTMPGTSLRIRIKDGREAVITHKLGEGLKRAEQEDAIPLESARHQLERACAYRLTKTRYLVDRFEIDQFHGPLNGLMIMEIELRSTDEPLPPFPRWISRTREVTDCIDNLALAELATFLGEKTSPHPIRDYITPSVPIMALTGGPCSGKTTTIESLKKDFGDKIVFLPEMATLLMQQLKISPPRADDPIGQAHFQRTLYRTQRITEAAAQREALLQGKKLVLTDRGTLDNAAYLPGDLKEFSKICGIDIHEESRRYMAVIALRTPPKEVYERLKGNNPARRESYEEAVALGKRMPEMWRYMPSHIYSPRHQDSWEAIYADIRTLVGDFVKARG